MDKKDTHGQTNREPGKKQLLMVGIAVAVLMIVLLTVIIGLPGGGEPPVTTGPSAAASDPSRTEPPQTTQMPQTTEPAQTTQPPETTQPPAASQPSEPAATMPSAPQDPEVPNQGGASDTVPEGDQPGKRTFGIDVSKYQGIIDWEQVAQAGVDFAMIRVGYRTLVDGAIQADSNGKYNLQEAQKYGIRTGAYFFSTAITEAEAVEEANWVADQIAQYSITYPVAYNCEGFSDPENRQHGLTKTQRTDIALAFLRTIRERGYAPMFYASQSELQGNAQWDTSRIEGEYQIWVAQYPVAAYPQTEKSDYTGTYAMWQYTANGRVPGISKTVDLNIAYVSYGGTEAPPPPTAPTVEVEPDWEAQMNFRPVQETVTAKRETNLRDIPSQGDGSRVLYTLKNGETAIRVAVSDYGWSRLEFNGQVCYAVSSLLTTDLTPPGPEVQTPFTPVNEQVTAKDVVNLRTLPSVEHPDSQVAAQLKNGEYITRTGINADVGWSRVEYNGQTLYCISSYLLTKEQSAAAPAG